MTEHARNDATASGDAPPEWTVDELAGRAGLPVRTIREYQTQGLVPAPRRRGREGVYGPGHLRRLQLIGRLRDRGYSLAGIRDLLESWSAGDDLRDVLGLQPDELVHVDEPGAPATLAQLETLLPALVPSRLAELEATGIVEPCGPERCCIPSPSLLQLVVDLGAAGVADDDVIALLDVIARATDAVAERVVAQLQRLPVASDPNITTSLLRRGRGLLAHGIGRLTLHRIGRRLGIGDEADVDATFDRVAGTRSEVS